MPRQTPPRPDHLLAADAFGRAPTPAQLAAAGALLREAGFVEGADGWVLDDTFPWAAVTPSDGLLFVHVDGATPAHLRPGLRAALDALGTAAAGGGAGLVRLDPLTRREIDAADWARRAAALGAGGR